jgi:2-polyprenyl-6-methoxyphenol hydroxylase-like FAD-dependent oxidoreductase
MMESLAQGLNEHRLGRVDVVIVGFGPAGAVAACWLGYFGIKTLVIEKSRTIWDIPRAMALDHEIMRVFQNLGVVKEILPHTAPFPASEHFGSKGQLIRKVDIFPPPYPMGYTPSLVFTQPAVEAILRRHVAEYADVTVWLGAEVIGVRQNRGEVSVDVQMENGTVATARASYLIACDGGGSAGEGACDRQATQDGSAVLRSGSADYLHHRARKSSALGDHAPARRRAARDRAGGKCLAIALSVAEPE